MFQHAEKNQIQCTLYAGHKQNNPRKTQQINHKQPDSD